MHAIRIHRRVESETLQLPELRDLIGKEVEIVVLEEPGAPSRQPGEKPDYSALAQVAGQNLIDPDAYQAFRAASMI
jgi:hypothetical protein